MVDPSRFKILPKHDPRNLDKSVSRREGRKEGVARELVENAPEHGRDGRQHAVQHDDRGLAKHADAHKERERDERANLWWRGQRRARQGDKTR
eukprot:COSAG05_NODE_1321_length_5191_cov_74.598586_6_plen_93_part_00